MAGKEYLKEFVITRRQHSYCTGWSSIVYGDQPPQPIIPSHSTFCSPKPNASSRLTMQTIQLIIFVAFVLSRAAASISSFSDPTSIVNINHDANRLSRALAAGQNQTQRSLRQHEGEDRGAIDKADEVVSKMKALMGTAKNVPNNLAALIAKRSKTAGEFVRRPFLVSKLSKRYNIADQLSFSTLKQLDKIDNMRIVDIKNGIKGNKKTPNGMRRKIKHFEGMKTAPQKFLESHVGRDMQRYGKDGSRWLSAGVVTRTTDQGERQILLISSSNPARGDFLLPKGGWDRGEKIKKAALREVMEEGGVCRAL